MIVLEARGVVHLPSAAWVTRYIEYCDKFIAENEEQELIARVPRAQDLDRAGLTPLQVARYFYRLKKHLLDKKPGAVSTFACVVVCVCQ